MKLSVVLPVLTPTPFLRAMTEFAIATLREHADNPFELIVVEAEGTHFEPPASQPHIYEYISFAQRQGSTKDFNAGARRATGEFIVSTGNDVIVPKGWDTELLRIFAAQADCGIASLAALEPGAVVGPLHGHELVSRQAEVGAVDEVEGMYSPFMAWRRQGGLADEGWLLDEAYRKIYCDSDIVMRHYEAGLRAYRSCRSHVHHLVRMTSARVDPQQHSEDLARDERLFYQRWGRKRHTMFSLIRAGQITYGREHLALTTPINLHYRQEG